MRFSVNAGRDESLKEIGELSRLAEDLGYSHLTLVDQQLGSRDVYLMMAAAAATTSRLGIGQGITVPLTRHPSVTANATATFDELSGGRAILGLGAGGNALRSIGYTPPPMKEHRAFVTFLRRYLAGEVAEYGGVRVRSEWLHQHPRHIPIYMVCAFPHSCALAGELADGVILGTGIHPELVRWRLEHVARGAAKAKRDLGDLDIWQTCMVYLTDSIEDAMPELTAQASPHLANTLLSDTPEAAELRRRLARSERDLDGLIEEQRRFVRAYDESAHETVGSPQSKLVSRRTLDWLHLAG